MGSGRSMMCHPSLPRQRPRGAQRRRPRTRRALWLNAQQTLRGLGGVDGAQDNANGFRSILLTRSDRTRRTHDLEIAYGEEVVEGHAQWQLASVLGTYEEFASRVR